MNTTPVPWLPLPVLASRTEHAERLVLLRARVVADLRDDPARTPALGGLYEAVDALDALERALKARSAA